MPYIDKTRKGELRPLLDKIKFAGPGDLTYAVSVLMINYLTTLSPHMLTFHALNGCIGAVELATKNQG